MHCSSPHFHRAIGCFLQGRILHPGSCCQGADALDVHTQTYLAVTCLRALPLWLCSKHLTASVLYGVGVHRIISYLPCGGKIDIKWRNLTTVLVDSNWKMGEAAFSKWLSYVKVYSPGGKMCSPLFFLLFLLLTWHIVWNTHHHLHFGFICVHVALCFGPCSSVLHSK